jgi:hypothetical protein
LYSNQTRAKPLTQEESMEEEVRQFKKDIEIKFKHSSHNNNYRFPFELEYQDNDQDVEIDHLKLIETYCVADQNHENITTLRNINQKKLIKDI